jgi:branched-chain amino acid transport system ATP-binding protein
MTIVAETSGLSRRYAGLIAVDQVDLAVNAGTVHALIGPNGAGKTTLFDLLSGLVRPSEGVVRLAGRDVTRLRPEQRAALGLARTFQNIRSFGAMTVLENVLSGLHLRRRIGLAGTVLRTPRFRAEERALLARARAVLGMVGLGSVEGQAAVALSYGDQRRLEIARAIAAGPALLLLDEPAAGMNPAETAALAALVRRIRAGGTTVLLVEHDMGFVMDIADVVTVLNFGRVIFEGTPAAVRQEPAVMEAYLGRKVAARLAARAQATPA